MPSLPTNLATALSLRYDYGIFEPVRSWSAISSVYSVNGRSFFVRHVEGIGHLFFKSSTNRCSHMDPLQDSWLVFKVDNIVLFLLLITSQVA